MVGLQFVGAVDLFPDSPAVMPEIVRAWFAENEAGFFGYGPADADDRLLGEILQPTNWR